MFVYGNPTIQPYKTPRGSWQWMNVGDLQVSLELGNSRVSFTVPDGFATDLASIPPVAQWLFFLNPYEPNVVLAALVHDWLSPTPAEQADLDNPFGQRPMFPATISAGVFLELMKAQGVSLARRTVYYRAVVAAIPPELR